MDREIAYIRWLRRYKRKRLAPRKVLGGVIKNKHNRANQRFKAINTFGLVWSIRKLDID